MWVIALLAIALVCWVSLGLRVMERTEEEEGQAGLLPWDEQESPVEPVKPLEKKISTGLHRI